MRTGRQSLRNVMSPALMFYTDRLGKMEVDLLPLAGPSPGWGVSRPVQDIRKEGQLLQNAVALFLKPSPRVQAGTRGYHNRCFLFSVFHGDPTSMFDIARIKNS